MAQRFLWATVTAASPLKIKLDGDTNPLPFTPSTLGGGVASVGDRVLVLLDGRTATVLTGRVPPPPPQLPTMNGLWIEERLGTNLYRWTQTFTVTVAVATAWGPIAWSGPQAMPTLPSGATITDWDHLSVRDSSNSGVGAWGMTYSLTQWAVIRADTGAPAKPWKVTISLLGTKP